jgi:hypothetical protein
MLISYVIWGPTYTPNLKDEERMPQGNPFSLLPYKTKHIKHTDFTLFVILFLNFFIVHIKKI